MYRQAQTNSTNNVNENVDENVDENMENITIKHYLKSIVFMPRSIQLLCVTNLFSWMAQVSYSLYFTDFVGSAIFHGDPTVIMTEPNGKAHILIVISFSMKA